MKLFHLIIITLVTTLCLVSALLGVNYADFDNYLGLAYILNLERGTGLHPCLAIGGILLYVPIGYMVCTIYSDITNENTD